MTDQLNVLQDEKPWYANGLRFECTGCGKCCTGAPGYVWVTEKEIEAIASYLKISVQEFGKKYLRRIDNRYSLIERSKTYDCVFLEDKTKCKIYPVRPTQCQTFPYWPDLLSSEKAWQEAASYCEGINDEASLIPYSVIKEQLSREESNS
jgi:uncharacterized protein